MIVYEITQGIIDKAYDMAEIGKEPYGEGTIRKDRSGILVGRIGEGVAVIHLDKHKPIWTLSEYGYDIRFPIGNEIYLSSDMKTKDRTVPPKLSYEASITEQALPYQKPNIYIFGSLERRDNLFIRCYLIGFCTRDFFLKEAIPLKEGDIDPSNGWKVKKACRNLPYSKLIPIEQFDEFLEKKKKEVIQNLSVQAASVASL